MNKQMEKISVIVPIYNVEKYLDKCVDSIVNQTYRNLEIILVDDGALDGSPKICDDWAKKDSRIKVIHKKNGGLSSARNAGIDAAQGNYLSFIDSDDWIDEDFIEVLYNAIIKDKSDLAICGFKKIEEDTCKVIYNEPSCDKDQYVENGLDLLFKQKNVSYVIACNKLYKKEIFADLRYMPGKIHDDEFVIYDVYTHAKGGVSLVNRCMYNYLQRGNSIISITNNEKIFDIIDAFKLRLSKIDKNSIYYSSAVRQYLDAFLPVYFKVRKNRDLRTKIFKNYKSEIKVLKNIKESKKFRLKHTLFKLFPKLTTFLMYKVVKHCDC